MNSNVCYAPSVEFKPEWAYRLPKGYRGESFMLPFSFSVPVNGAIQVGYPWRLDDDVPWIWRGVVFPQIGTAQIPGGNPGLVRIWDPFGNPLTNCPETNDFVLGWGVIGQSGFSAINAFGFPLGAEIECPPGGVIQFDFQIPQAAGGPSVAQVQGTMLGVKLFEDC